MTTDNAPPDRNLLSGWTPWIAVVVLIAVVAGVYAVWRESGKDRTPNESDYDVERYKVIPPEQIGYVEVARIETGLTTATALCTGPGDEIAVGGDKRVLVYGPDGTLRGTISTEKTPLALAISRKGRLYVAFRNRVVSAGLDEPVPEFCAVAGAKARITSIAVDRNSVYIADAGSRRVWRYSLAGEPMGRIGDKNADRNIPGFNVPSPYFDLLVAPDGLLRVVDPGRHRITAFTTGGDLEFSWGKPSMTLPGFNGCCNPSHIAMLPDGRFVTSEKGIPRVKVHDAEGNFVTAVVGAHGLATETEPCDVATDSEGRILVLDPGSATVRIFEPKERPDRER